MAIVNITSKFLNQDKRYEEAVVVTVPAVIRQGGGRSQAEPIYLQGSDDMTASVIERDTIVQKCYLIVDEAFPAGAVAAVTVGGTAYHAAIDLTAVAMTTSATEDEYFADGGDVVVTVTGIAGDVTTGKLRVVVDTVHPSLQNGQYAN